MKFLKRNLNYERFYELRQVSTSCASVAFFFFFIYLLFQTVTNDEIINAESLKDNSYDTNIDITLFLLFSPRNDKAR